MTEAAKPVAWIDEKGQIHHSPRHHFLGLWNDTCGSAEALWSGCSLDEAVAKWKELISRGEREVDLTGFGCGILANHRDLERRYGEPKGTFMCWVCGRDTPHQHTPEEIERGREHDRWASEQDEKRWAETLTRIASLEARYLPRTPLYAHPPTAGVPASGLPQQWEALIEEAVAAFAEGNPLGDRLPNAMAALRDALAYGMTACAPVWEYHWLVELFHRGDGAPSMGRYHTGLTDISHQSRSTTQPHEARRYTKEQAQRVAGELNVHMMACEWRAVEHGFLVAAPGVAIPQNGQEKNHG